MNDIQQKLISRLAQRDNKKLFGKIFRTDFGTEFGIEMLPALNKYVTISKIQRINHFLNIRGHPNEEILRNNAKN